MCMQKARRGAVLLPLGAPDFSLTLMFNKRGASAEPALLLPEKAGFSATHLASKTRLCRDGLILRSPPVALLLKQAHRGAACLAGESRGSRAGETESGECGADQAAEVKELSFIHCM